MSHTQATLHRSARSLARCFAPGDRVTGQKATLDERDPRLRAENQIWALYLFVAFAGVLAGLALLSLPEPTFMPAAMAYGAGLGWVVGAGVPVQLVLWGRLHQRPTLRFILAAQVTGAVAGLILCGVLLA